MVNVRERDFGVFRFWEELRTRYPSFEFFHGHGLGVLGYGPNLAPEVAELLAATREREFADELRRVFSRLGGGVKAEQLTREQLVEIREREGEIRDRDAQIAKLNAHIENVLEARVNAWAAQPHG